MNINKKFLVSVVILVIFGGFFWYLVVQNNRGEELVVGKESVKDSNVWSSWSDEDIGISFNYPTSWGTPKIYKEGDIFKENVVLNEIYKDKYNIPKGKFLISFSLSSPVVKIEGFNDNYVQNEPFEDEDWTSCALHNLKYKDDAIYKKLNLKLNVPIYSIIFHESEGRLGLFGDVILSANKKYPSMCATLALDTRSELFSKVMSEQVPKGYTNDGTNSSFFGKILSSEYLKKIDSKTEEMLNNFERFSASIKTF